MSTIFILLALYVVTIGIFIYFVLRYYPNIRTVKDLIRTVNYNSLGFMWIPLLNTAVILTIALGIVVCKIVNFINDIKIK